MAVDQSYVEQNRASTERIREMGPRLTDAQFQTKVGEHWTVSVVMAHIAFWERRVVYVLDKTEEEGKLVVPDVGIVVNDLSLPLWAAVPPREALRLAIEACEACDKRLESYPPALLEEVYNYQKRWVFRALHRNEHLNEADAALNK